MTSIVVSRNLTAARAELYWSAQFLRDQQRFGVNQL